MNEHLCLRFVFSEILSNIVTLPSTLQVGLVMQLLPPLLQIFLLELLEELFFLSGVPLEIKG